MMRVEASDVERQCRVPDPWCLQKSEVQESGSHTRICQIVLRPPPTAAKVGGRLQLTLQAFCVSRKTSREQLTFQLKLATCLTFGVGIGNMQAAREMERLSV